MTLKRFSLFGMALALCVAATPVLAQVAPPTITTPSLPNATVGVPYSQQLVATGGTPPYKWSLASLVSVVNGISINQTTGILSGTPLTPQVLSLDIFAADSSTPPRLCQKDVHPYLRGPSPRRNHHFSARRL